MFSGGIEIRHFVENGLIFNCYKSQLQNSSKVMKNQQTCQFPYFIINGNSWHDCLGKTSKDHLSQGIQERTK